MIKRIIAVLLICSMMLCGCQTTSVNQKESQTSASIEDSADSIREEESIEEETESAEEETESAEEEAETRTDSTPVFSGMSDPKLLTYVEDIVYSDLVATVNNRDYFVENIDAVYVSKEYIDDLNYNSQSNIYFGFTLEELQQQFQGKKYVFTLSDDGVTTVKELEEYIGNPYSEIIKNVAIGSGVILLCVTISCVSEVVGVQTVTVLFASAAKEAAKEAFSESLKELAVGLVTGYITDDKNDMMRTATKASEKFKWGAITGAISGATKNSKSLHGTALIGLSIIEAANAQKESGYPLDVIKAFQSIDQYKMCREAGLVSQMVNGKLALIRDIDLDDQDDSGRTNRQRMNEGMAAVDQTGKEYKLFHVGQEKGTTLAILTEEEYRESNNDQIWYSLDENYNTESVEFWKSLGQMLA